MRPDRPLKMALLVAALTSLTVLLGCTNPAPTATPTTAPPTTATPMGAAASAPTPTPILIGSETATRTLTPTATPTPVPTPTPTPLPATRTVVDDLGRTVEIPYSPQRVAATVSWQVELMMACGIRPVARPDIPLEFVYPPEARDISAIAVSHRAGPSLEQLAVARPDLVLTSPTFAQFVPSIEEALGVPVLVHDISSFDGVIEKLRTYGGLLGCQQKAHQAAQELQKELRDLQAGVPATGPKVFALFGTTQSFLGFMPASYLGDMVRLLGGRLITEGDPPRVTRGETDPGFTPFSLEKVVERGPDVILVVRHGAPSPAREENFAALFSDPAWRGLRAVQEGRVYELAEWLYLRYPGPRVILAMEKLRRILYPEE